MLLDHPRADLTERLGDNHQGRARANHRAGVGMPELMEGDVLKVGLCYCGLEAASISAGLPMCARTFKEWCAGIATGSETMEQSHSARG